MKTRVKIKLKQIDPRKLREARENANLTQQDVAAALGVTSVQVCHIERGRSGIRTDYLYAWGTICGVEDLRKFYSYAEVGAFDRRKKLPEIRNKYKNITLNNP